MSELLSLARDLCDYFEAVDRACKTKDSATCMLTIEKARRLWQWANLIVAHHAGETKPQHPCWTDRDN